MLEFLFLFNKSNWQLSGFQLDDAGRGGTTTDFIFSTDKKHQQTVLRGPGVFDCGDFSPAHMIDVLSQLYFPSKFSGFRVVIKLQSDETMTSIRRP